MLVLAGYTPGIELSYKIISIDTGYLIIMAEQRFSAEQILDVIRSGKRILNAALVNGALKISGSLEAFTEPTQGLLVIGKVDFYYAVTDGKKVWLDTLSSVANSKLINAKLGNYDGKYKITMKRGSLPELVDCEVRTNKSKK